MIELRGADGQLCGRYDPRTMRLEIKPKHGQTSTFDLRLLTDK